MQVILWRHADAEDGGDDLARRLTAKGEAQAAAMASWLRRHLPDDYVVLASPARRAQQTAAALQAAFETARELAPGASPRQILELCGKRQGLVIVVGHQPDLGRAAAQLVSGSAGEWPIDKGALWWIDGRRVKAVVSPETL
ncbi:MAG TPA: histidine phosphatase family protein [Burkholderiales bacterium]